MDDRDNRHDHCGPDRIQWLINAANICESYPSNIVWLSDLNIEDRRRLMFGERCGICRQPLDISTNLLSRNCGGDCWGCISSIEAHGLGYSPDYYRQHHDKIWKERDER